jgi:16S rRNA (guanine527-N7)-methyltransferase
VRIRESNEFQTAIELLANGGFHLPEDAIDRLDKHLELIQTLGPTFGVMSKGDAEQGAVQHVVDSMSLLQSLGPVTEIRRLVDVGSGGGLPGLVLAACLSNVDVVLLERSEKKCAFLNRCVGELALTSVQVEAREFSTYDWGASPLVVTVRAIEKAQTVLKQLLEILPAGSRCFWMTGTNDELDLPERFHVEQIVDEWSVLGLRRGALIRVTV